MSSPDAHPATPPMPHDGYCMRPDEARLIVRETVREMFTTMGVDLKDPLSLQADFAFLRKQRTGVDDLSKWAKRSAIGVAVSSGLYALYSGAADIIKAKFGGG